MKSSEHRRILSEARTQRTEAHAPSGRNIERYHYSNGQHAECLLQSKGSHVLLEHVPALLQAVGIQ